MCLHCSFPELSSSFTISDSPYERQKKILRLVFYFSSVSIYFWVIIQVTADNRVSSTNKTNKKPGWGNKREQ